MEFPGIEDMTFPEIDEFAEIEEKRFVHETTRDELRQGTFDECEEAFTLALEAGKSTDSMSSESINAAWRYRTTPFVGLEGGKRAAIREVRRKNSIFAERVERYELIIEIREGVEIGYAQVQADPGTIHYNVKPKRKNDRPEASDHEADIDIERDKLEARDRQTLGAVKAVHLRLKEQIALAEAA